MVEVTKGIFTGNDYDYYLIKDKNDWAVLHCCKDPFHKDFVGYRGSLSSNHPNYAYYIKGNEMALNLVDLDNFNKAYLGFNEEMVEAAFNFLDSFKNNGKKILIHCNQGESRGPSLCMLYSAKCGAFDYANFEDTVYEFRYIYPNYNPKYNIYCTVRYLWEYFVKGAY